MTMYRVLFCLVAAATATASVAPLPASKFSSSKVLALRGGAKEVSDSAITSENFVKVAAALFVWNNYVENNGDNKWGTGNLADIPNWAKVAGVWFLFTQNEGDFSFKGDNAWLWLLAIPLFFSGRK